jgi:hypothetical protein
MRSVVGWVATSAFLIAAIVRANTGQVAPGIWRSSESTRREIFRVIARGEAEVRARAARGFPGDLWSADDDFHSNEQRSARAAAGARGLSIAESLRAVDEGLREGWPHDNPEPLIATVPPCHPRPEY